MGSSADPSSHLPSLSSRLSQALPDGFHCSVRHMRTPSKPCDSLFSAFPGREPEKTRLSSHFIMVSIDSNSLSQNSSAVNSQSVSRTSEVAGLAIEVLIYRTKLLTTIFVSKADSTGYLPRTKPSVIGTVATAFLRWLTDKERRKYPTRKLVISLFARAQSQYLFPGSAENSLKHVLDDRQLIRWWTRVLDPLLTTLKESIHENELNVQGYVTVPGYEGQAEIRQFLPHSYIPGGAKPHWKAGHPLYELAQARGVPEAAPPRCLLPRFPDDPKARFIQDLDDEVGISSETGNVTSPRKQGNGKWKSIGNLARFWEAMGFRQECSSGKMVGFLWLVFSRIITDRAQETLISRQLGGSVDEELHNITCNYDTQHLITQTSEPSPRPEASVVNESISQKRRGKPLTGPIIPRQPRLKTGSSSLSANSGSKTTTNQDRREELVLSSDAYDKAMQTLLHLDFANLGVATHSTKKWISEVSSICGSQLDWSCEIRGTAVIHNANGNSSNGAPVVNDLGGMVKKKRKLDTPPQSQGSTASGEPQTATVNVLGESLIRKKPKPVQS